MFKAFHQYKKIDGDLSAAAEKAFSFHTWYLVAELVPLCLFSENCEEKDKEEIRHLLLKYKDHEMKPTIIKPTLPVITLQNMNKISSFFGSRSFLFFYVLKINSSFLYYPVDQWEELNEFNEAKDVVNGLHVVNDISERGIKLCSDFLHNSKSEKNCKTCTRLFITAVKKYKLYSIKYIYSFTFFYNIEFYFIFY